MTEEPQRVALYLQDKHPIRDGMDYARYAESQGFEAVWQAESRLVRDAGHELRTPLTAIRTNVELLANVPAARLFDEFLKLFLAGHAAATLDKLLEYRLLQYLLPESAHCLQRDAAALGAGEQPHGGELAGLDARPALVAGEVARLGRGQVLILDAGVFGVGDKRVATDGDYDSGHYSHTPRTDDRRAMRMTTPL